MVKKKEVKITNIIDTNLEDKIIIERVNDGYILTEYEEDEIIVNDEPKEVYREIKTVVEDSINEIQDELEFDETSDGNRKEITSSEAGLYRLLLILKNKYGVHYSDHKPINLAVEFQENKKSEPVNINEKLKLIRNVVIELAETGIDAVGHVGSANYQSREDEAQNWVYKKEAEVLKMIDKLMEE